MLGWEYPKYTVFKEHEKSEFIEKIRSFDSWIIGLDYEPKELEEYKIAYVKPTDRSREIIMYGQRSKKYIALPKMEYEERPVNIADNDFDIDGNDSVEFVRIDVGEYAKYRAILLTKDIAPSMPSHVFGVQTRGKIIGFLGLQTNEQGVRKSPVKMQPSAFLLSDFPVTTKIKKASKLIAALATSVEFQKICEKYSCKKIRSISTAVFSKNPVSMKYRGRWKLINRKESKGDDNTKRDYCLSYCHVYDGKTVKEIMKEHFGENGNKDNKQE